MWRRRLQDGFTADSLGFVKAGRAKGGINCLMMSLWLTGTINGMEPLLSSINFASSSARTAALETADIRHTQLLTSVLAGRDETRVQQIQTNSSLQQAAAAGGVQDHKPAFNVPQRREGIHIGVNGPPAAEGLQMARAESQS